MCTSPSTRAFSLCPWDGYATPRHKHLAYRYQWMERRRSVIDITRSAEGENSRLLPVWLQLKLWQNLVKIQAWKKCASKILPSELRSLMWYEGASYHMILILGFPSGRDLKSPNFYKVILFSCYIGNHSSSYCKSEFHRKPQQTTQWCKIF